MMMSRLWNDRVWDWAFSAMISVPSLCSVGEGDGFFVVVFLLNASFCQHSSFSNLPNWVHRPAWEWVGLPEGSPASSSLSLWCCFSSRPLQKRWLEPALLLRNAPPPLNPFSFFFFISIQFVAQVQRIWEPEILMLGLYIFTSKRIWENLQKCITSVQFLQYWSGRV